MTGILASDWSEHWRPHTMFISRQLIRGWAESARQKTVSAYPNRRRFPLKRQFLTALFDFFRSGGVVGEMKIKANLSQRWSWSWGWAWQKVQYTIVLNILFNQRCIFLETKLMLTLSNRNKRIFNLAFCCIGFKFSSNQYYFTTLKLFIQCVTYIFPRLIQSQHLQECRKENHDPFI